jgi:hypothetical protein
VVLQAPGVVQDSYGQPHLRGDHANVQCRIDGVVVPEAISGRLSLINVFDRRYELRDGTAIGVGTPSSAPGAPCMRA